MMTREVGPTTSVVGYEVGLATGIFISQVTMIIWCLLFVASFGSCKCKHRIRRHLC